jgi:hypothetical protein
MYHLALVLGRVDFAVYLKLAYITLWLFDSSLNLGQAPLVVMV